MKRFLYAAMLASMAITGCGPKKEMKSTAPAMEQAPAKSEGDMTDDELLAVLDLLDETETSDDSLSDDSLMDDSYDDDLMLDYDNEDLDEDMPDDLDNSLDDALLSEEDDIDDIFKGMTPEQIDAAQEEAMRELALILKAEQERNPSMAAMGADLFDPALDMEKLSPEERESLLAWETSAIDFARKELEAAAMESELLGFTAINFAANSAEIPAGQQEALQKNITVARAALAAGRDLVLAGHAEKDATNPVELSQKRADALRNAFIAAGLDAEHLHAAGYGEALGELMTPASDFSVELLVC